MKKTTLLLIFALLILLAGCGKKEENVKPEKNFPKTVEKKIENKKAQIEETIKYTDSPAETEEVTALALPEFDLVSDYTFVFDVTNDHSVGQFSRSYIYPTEETEKSYPMLAASLKKINDKISNELNSSFLDFKGVAQRLNDNCFDTDEITVVRADKEYTSFYTRKYSFWGNGEPFDEYLCENINNSTGESLDINDIVLDADKFNDAINTAYSEKFGGNQSYNFYSVENSDVFNYCLTPLGIDVFFASDNPAIENNFGKYVHIGFNEYPEALNGKYKSESEDYVFPFNADEKLSVDIDNDGKLNEISFSPIVSPDSMDFPEYQGYSLTVDGKSYDNFSDNWYFAWQPYYVHTKDSNYLYLYFEDYETVYIHKVKFEGIEPVYNELVDGLRIYAKEVQEHDGFGRTNRAAFTNSAVISNFNFGEVAVGPYLYVNAPTDEDENSEHLIEIYEVDGRYYIEYLSDFSYGAGEIEILSDKPEIVGDDCVFRTKIHYFSGFSFAGDFWGDNYECNMVCHGNGGVSISPENPFSVDTVELYPFYDTRIHENIYNYCVANDICKQVCGSFRAENTSDKSESYIELFDYGTANYAIKKEAYPVNLNFGIYSINESVIPGEYEITFEGEMLGYAGMPFDGTSIVYNSEKDILTIDGVEFYRTEPGVHKFDIVPGPSSRTDEIQESWKDYLSVDEYEDED